MKKYLLYSLALLLTFPLIGDEDIPSTCPNCGSCVLKSVCRLVPSKKKETKTIYCCKKEDVCLPGKSTKCGKECVPDCETKKGFHYETLWQPSCGKIVCKTSLMKKTVTEEKEVCVCKLMKCCCDCGHEFDPAKKPEAATSQEAK